MRRQPRPVTDIDNAFIRENLWKLGCTECGRRLGRNASTISQIAKRLGVAPNPQKSSNRADISWATDLKDPFAIYFLGYFWADGSITSEKKHRIKFKIVTSDYDAAIKPHLNRIGGDSWNQKEYRDARNPHWSPTFVLDTTHRELWKFLNDYDYRIKSGASADKILAAIPPELRHYWWRGFLDGDGSVATYGRITFNSGLNQDWAFADQLGRELDINFTLERSDRGSRGGSKMSVGNFVYVKKLVNYLYQGEKFGLERKRKRCFDYVAKASTLKPSSSKYRGVHRLRKDTGKFWHCQISTNGFFYSKCFYTEIEAAQEYDRKAKELFGNKARLNFNV